MPRRSWTGPLSGLLVCWFSWSPYFAVSSRAEPPPEYTVLSLDRPSCLEVGLISMRRLPHLFLAGEVDSVTSHLDRWQDACGALEPVSRTRLLAEIWRGSFREEDADGTVFDHLLAWPRLLPAETRRGEAGAYPLWSEYTRDLRQSQQSFDAFTRWLAVQLLPAVSSGSSARLICSHLAGHHDLLAQLRQSEYRQSRLFQIFVSRAMQARQRLHTAWAIYVGATNSWRQEGDGSAQPLLGFRYGIQASRTWLRAAVELGGRSLPASDLASQVPTASISLDSVTTWQRTDAAIAVELGRVLVSGWRHSLEAGCGLSYGSRHYHPGTDPDEPPHQRDDLRIRNGQASVLLGYGYHFGSLGGSVLQLELKYGWVRWAEYHSPRWFVADWSVRLVFSRHRLDLPHG